MGDDNSTITSQQIRDYLLNNRHFLVEHPDILEQLDVATAPDGTISLAQRQMARLQEKNAQLQEQMQTLIENARQNMQLQEKVHKLCLSMMAEHHLTRCLETLVATLKAEFNADEVALKLFYHDKTYTLEPTDHAIEQTNQITQMNALFDRVLGRHQTVCGRFSQAQKESLFPDNPAKAESMACIPIGQTPCKGLLAIASEDHYRFHADMATDYLTFLGDTLSHILSLHPPHNG